MTSPRARRKAGPPLPPPGRGWPAPGSTFPPRQLGRDRREEGEDTQQAGGWEKPSARLSGKPVSLLTGFQGPEEADQEHSWQPGSSYMRLRGKFPAGNILFCSSGALGREHSGENQSAAFRPIDLMQHLPLHNSPRTLAISPGR